jgi:murein DD-endopeptidase MepM/ murein hydrolase activator NlpD
VPVEPLYRLPLPGSRQTFLLIQGIGGRFSHEGDQTWAFDWAMPTGTPVSAARDGVVEGVRSEADDRSRSLEKRRANYVRVRHLDGTTGVYAHLDSTSLRIGARVRAGETIGWSGNTGYSTQPHLHFHVEVNGASVPCAFADSDDEGGVPRVGRLYRGSWER